MGHPLVRCLIEAVKQHAFLPSMGVEHYGRTAYVVTSDVDEVTALFHLLARYVVHTEPTSIIEELLPVAAPVYRLEPEAVGRERAEQLAEARPSEQTRTGGEVQEALADALRMEGLEVLLTVLFPA